MPFTFDALNKYVKFEFVAGDPKGDSLANAVTLDDYATAMAGAGYGANWVQQGNVHTLIDWRIYIVGSDTWVHFYDACIQFTGTMVASIFIYITSGAHFIVGSDVLTSIKQKGGCTFLFGSTNPICNFNIDGANAKIYDSMFTDVLSRNRVNMSCKGISEDQPVLIDRCIFLKTRVAISTLIPYSAEYVVLKDLLIKESSYGISFGPTEYLEINGLNVDGRFSDVTSSFDGIRKLYNLKCPLGTMLVRSYYPTTKPIMQLIDSILGSLTVKANYGVSPVGAKATIEKISKFSFYIENGNNATIKVWNKNDELLLDDVLDGSGELADQELKYYELSQEKIDGGYININEYYHPFRIEITRAGWDMLSISTEIIDGEPTIIRGTLEYPELLISAVDITDCTKIGINDGKLVITAEGGDATYTYSINGTDYQASDTFSGLSAGDYTVYVKDGEGTVANFEVTISQPIPEAYAEDVLTCDLTEESLDCDLAEEILTCDFIE